MSAEPLLHVVLHEPEIPQNTGNIGRTCVAVQAKLWLIQPLGFRMSEKSLRRAGLDYWEHLDWELAHDWADLERRLEMYDAWLFTKSAERPYTKARFSPGSIMVFGSETRGLPRSLTQAAPERSLRIPMRPEVRSLNLSNSVAIAAYEAVRQMGVEL